MPPEKRSPKIQFAKPKVQQSVAAATELPTVAFAKEKPRPLVDWPAVERGEPGALVVLSETARKWYCPDCPGIIREDGLALHHYACPYWSEHPDETPF